MQNYLFDKNIDPQQYLENGSIFINAGVAFAIAAKAGTNIALKGKGYGLTEGGKIVRRTQVIAYAIPLTLGLFFNSAADSQKSNIEVVNHNSADRHEVSMESMQRIVINNLDR